MTKRLGLALAAALVALLAFAAAAGAADQPLRLTEAKSAGFPQVAWVLSTPGGQRIVASQVGVTENGEPVVDEKIVPAGAGGNKTSGTVLVIDASDSMKGQPISSALAAARKFAAQRNVNQKLAVDTFNASNAVATPFTASQQQIQQALSKTPTTQYGTHLYDAVAQAIAQIQSEKLDVGSIVVLSDGADTGSQIGLDQVTKNARDANIRVFTVAFNSTTNRPTALQQLATDTGGAFSQANSAQQLSTIYDQLGLQLAHEYLLTYNSTIKPNQPVKVAVNVNGVGKTAAGYVTPTLIVPNAVYHKSVLDPVWKSPATMIFIALLIPALLAAAVLVPMRQRNSTVRARVSDYVSMPRRKQEADALVSRVFTGTERSLERTAWWQKFKDALQFADIGIAPIYIVFGTVIVTLLAMWVLALITPWLALFGLLVPFVVRAVILGRMARKRRLFGDQLADNLDVLASGLRAGHSLIGAFSVVVNDAPEPSKSEFRHVIADEQLGVSLEEALGGVARRMKSRDMDQVVLVASVQGETGGNAAEVLDRVTESIRERQELRRLVRTLTAQGRLARWIVSALPVALLFLITLLNHGYMKPLFNHTSGLVLLVFAGLMIVAGSVVIGRIVDIEV